MTLTRIDEELARQLSGLCTQENPPSFISRLPNELLASIFIFRALDHYCENIEGKTGRNLYMPDWVSVSYVCCHWRDVALKCPTLWSYVFTMSRRWTEVLLARSEQVPLKIRIEAEGLGRSLGLNFAEKLMNHVERIQEFRARFSWWDTEAHQNFSKLLSSAHRLQYLELSMEPIGRRWPEVLFHHNSPAPWNSYKLDGLTALSLHSIPPSLRQDIVKFQTILSSMQDLTHLFLEDALTSARDFISSAAFDTFQKVNLPHLSHLLIIAPLSTIIAFFSGVNVPVQTKMRLTCDATDIPSPDDYTRLCSTLAKHYDKDRAITVPVIRSVAIRPAEEVVALAFSTSRFTSNPPFPAAQRDWDSEALLQIFAYIPEFMHDDLEVHSIAFTADICSSMPTTDVQNLYVVHPPFCSAFWEKVLDHFPGLRHIKLSRGHLPNLACALSLVDTELVESSSEQTTSSASSNRILAPELEELELDHIIFLPGPISELDTCMRTVGDLHSLYAALSSHRRSRVRLTMTACCVDGDDKDRYDMVGWSERGQVHVLEERRYLLDSDTNLQDLGRGRI